MDDMSEMIERVAKALAKLHYGHDKGNWGMYKMDARAAIEAMRWPTEAMSVAGGLQFEAIAFEPDTDGSGIVFTDMGRVFTAMVDAALSPAGEK